MQVVSVEPVPQALAVDPLGPIDIEFDQRVDPASVTRYTFYVFGRWSGRASGSVTVLPGGRVLRFVPLAPFSAGERVMVVLSRAISSTDGTTLRRNGYSWSFWVRAEPASMVFTEVDRFTTRGADGLTTRPYGGFAANLDGDGFLDLAISCEDTDDVRTFLNLGDGTGRFGPLVQPANPTDVNSSSNEPADFNADGLTDAVIANHAADTISVLLGLGNGTFAPQQLISIPTRPRGVAVLDVDGDGDIDIAVNNAVSGDLAILTNDGLGVFTEVRRIPVPYPLPWAIATDDFDGDMIPDLVTGARDTSGGRVMVYRGLGRADFELVADVPAGTGFWNLATGDVDADGNTDVAIVGGNVDAFDTGTILFGDGMGGLSPPVQYPSDSFGISSDLGDLDGDGDLDWVLSSYLGNYFLYENDGTGSFTLNQVIVPTSAASCAILFDANGDRRLDMAIVDEVSDDVAILVNGSPP